MRHCRRLQEAYRDRGVTAVMVERLGEPKVGTLDLRPVTAVRPAHVEAVEMMA